MKKQEFLKLVHDEIETIKKRATKKEIAKLDFSTFDHESGNNCIYGQIAGDCSSVRAKRIMKKSFRRLVAAYRVGYNDPLFSQQSFEKGRFFTALEKYLFLKESKPKHKKIIKYLKGLTKTNPVKFKL